MVKQQPALQFMLQGLSGNSRGISIIEILVVIFIIAVSLSGLLGLVSLSLGASTSIKQNAKANSLAQETMEAIRNFRDGTTWDVDGLASLATMSFYYPEKSGDTPAKWQMVSGQEQIDGFTRKFALHQVERDANGNIVESGGVDDPDTRKATVFISWEEKGRSHQISISTYFTNWKR